MKLKNAKVLVTGADGFIGSHLVERLHAVGARVRALCLYNSQGSMGWLDRIEPEAKAGIEVRLGDIRDARFTDALCEGVDIVFHLAALISVPFSYESPEAFLDTNVRGTFHVLEAVRRRGLRMIHTSSSEVYGTPQTLPILETHALRAQSPYAASKVAADQLVSAYHLSYGTAVMVLRPFNTYGPRQSTRALTATILYQLLSGKREVALGRTDTKRDLTYVADVVEGFLKAAASDRVEGEVIQLGTGRALRVDELFQTACKVTGIAATLRVDKKRMRPDTSEVMELKSDPSRARRLLAWQATTEIEDGLRKTAAWMQRNLDYYRDGFLR